MFDRPILYSRVSASPFHITRVNLMITGDYDNNKKALVILAGIICAMRLSNKTLSRDDIEKLFL